MQIKETKDFNLMGQLGKTMQEKHRTLYPEFFKPYDEESIAQHFETVFQNPKEKVFLWLDDSKEDQPVSAYLWLSEQEIKETPFRYGYTRLYVSHIAVLPDYQTKASAVNCCNLQMIMRKKKRSRMWNCIIGQITRLQKRLTKKRFFYLQ